MFDKMGCEEFYKDPVSIQLALGVQGETTTFISPNLLIVALHVDGVLVKSIGTTVKAEQVEMNCVKVTCGDEETFYELGTHVRWMDMEEGYREVR
jgi:hypothetical protein